MSVTLACALVIALRASSPGALTFNAPEGWVAKTPSSSMRVAEFALPKAAGDREEASLVVYYFGGGGGSVEANLDRWASQMAQPDGKPSSAAGATTHLDSHGLSITVLDISGTYIAESMPGSTEHYNGPGIRMLAAVVETPEGSYYVKLLGPERTVARWHESFLAFLKSVRVE